MTARTAPTRVELGCAGHLIVSTMCRFHRHTQIGDTYRVSTVGDYYPNTRGTEVKRETIGAGPDAYFETMVFRTLPTQDEGNEGCGGHKVADWSEIDGKRYATAGEAQVGHEAMVAKYLRLDRTRAPRGAGKRRGTR